MRVTFLYTEVGYVSIGHSRAIAFTSLHYYCSWALYKNKLNIVAYKNLDYLRLSIDTCNRKWRLPFYILVVLLGTMIKK